MGTGKDGTTPLGAFAEPARPGVPELPRPGQALRFGVRGLGFRVSGLGFRIWDLGFGFRFQGGEKGVTTPVEKAHFGGFGVCGFREPF